MPRPTSLEAYGKAVRTGVLSKRRYQVVWALFHLSQATCSEVYQRIVSGWHASKRSGSPPPKDSYNPRFAELEKQGIIRMAGTRTCRVTGNRAIQWELTGHIPEAPVRLKERNKEICPTCGQVLRTRR